MKKTKKTYNIYNSLSPAKESQKKMPGEVIRVYSTRGSL